jgi:hypothetical protein
MKDISRTAYAYFFRWMVSTNLDVPLSIARLMSNFLISRMTILVAFVIAIAFSIVATFLSVSILAVATDN